MARGIFTRPFTYVPSGAPNTSIRYPAGPTVKPVKRECAEQAKAADAWEDVADDGSEDETVGGADAGG